jgi:CheY-like chemotaxis protein
MTPETLNQVFDPFFTTKQPGEGTGLGLSVVHGIVKSHNGYISVESAPEKGTTFHIYLPRIKEEERFANKETLSVTGGKERILIVDDEDMLVELNKQRLCRLGYEVVATTSSMEALAIFRKEPHTFDLVITDYTMPNLTGIDLAVELLKVRATVPIILCTGQSDTISLEKTKQIGIREFLMKPLTIRELAQAVRRVLDEK